MRNRAWIQIAALALGATLLASPKAHRASCEEAYGGLIDAHYYAGLTCDTLDRQSIDTSHGRIVVDVVLRDAAANPAGMAAMTRSVSLAHDVVVEAVRTYDQFGAMPPRIQTAGASSDE
jgi:hypothetical protein